MGAEMAGGEEVRVWRKAIPEGRDRMQSRVLVWVVGCLLIWMTFEVLRSDYLIWDIAFLRPFALISIAVSVAFAVLVRALRAATTTASLFGGMICLTLIDGTAPRFDSQVLSGVTPLVMLFLLTFLSTRVGRRKKAAAGLAEGRKGRSAAQVIANLSISALSVSYLVLLILTGIGPCCVWDHPGRWLFPVMMMMCLAALVEATADTVSSEIGQAFGGRPVMVLSLKRVEVGTDGAVTLLGSGAGILAGALVAAAGLWGLNLNVREACIAFVAGVCGLFFDSLLGATVERRGWLGNDLVNFSSTVFAAGVAVLGYRVVIFGW